MDAGSLATMASLQGSRSASVASRSSTTSRHRTNTASSLQDYGGTPDEEVHEGEDQPCSSWFSKFLVAWLACFVLFGFGIALPAIPRPFEINTVMCPGWTPPPEREASICPATNESQAAPEDVTTLNKYACPQGLVVKGVTEYAVDAIGGVVTGKLWGVLSDRYGRRPFLIFNALAYMVSSLCLYFAHGWLLFIMSQVRWRYIPLHVLLH
jgi:hypothetical protein